MCFSIIGWWGFQIIYFNIQMSVFNGKCLKISRLEYRYYSCYWALKTYIFNMWIWIFGSKHSGIWIWIQVSLCNPILNHLNFFFSMWNKGWMNMPHLFKIRTIHLLVLMMYMTFSCNFLPDLQTEYKPDQVIQGLGRLYFWLVGLALMTWLINALGLDYVPSCYLTHNLTRCSWAQLIALFN